MSSNADRQTIRATLHQVADLAGVSPSTVSLVLAGKAVSRRISKETQARVRRIAEEVNYAPNLLTRSLRRGRTHILSFFNAFRNREQMDMYMDQLSSAIETAGGEMGYDVLVHCNYRRSATEIYQFLNGGWADGLILFAPLESDPLLPLLRRSALPVVLLNGRDPKGLFPSVAEDARTGMRMVADELLARGHRRIAIFLPRYEERDALLRQKILREYLAEVGIDVPERWIRATGADARGVLGELMAEPEPPTAVFCWHDRLAYGVIQSAEEMGISVPDRLAVVGYDGLHWPSSTRHVVSSVQVDFYALARAAVRVLDQYVNGYDGPLLEEVLPVTFLSGTSLNPPS